MNEYKNNRDLGNYFVDTKGKLENKNKKNKTLEEFEDMWMNFEKIGPELMFFLKNPNKTIELKNHSRNEKLSLLNNCNRVMDYFEKAKDAYLLSIKKVSDDPEAEKTMKAHWGEILLYVGRIEEVIKALNSK